MPEFAEDTEELFEENADDEQTDWLLIGAVIVLLLTLGGQFANYPAVRDVANLYIIIALIGLIFYGFNKIRSDMEFGASGLGSWNNMLYGGAIGFVLAFVMLSAKFTIAAPLAVATVETTNTIMFGILQNADYLYNTIFAPIIEEFTFRGVLNYTFISLFAAAGLSRTQAGVAGITLVSGFFAYFHGFMFGFTEVLMMSAFMFGIAMSFLNGYFRSIMPSIVIHAINNHAAWVAEQAARTAQVAGAMVG